MKCLTRILTVVLLLMMVIGALPVSAAGATATIGQATAHPGDTVTLTLSANDFAAISGIDIHIRYDASRLECVTADVVGLAADMEMASANTAVAGHADEIWLTAMTLSSVDGDGDLLDMTFRVKADAAEGLAMVEVIDRPAQLVDVDAEAVPLAIVSGGVTVQKAAADTTAKPSTATTTISSQETVSSETKTQTIVETTTVTATATTTATMTATMTPQTVMTKPDGGEIVLPEPEQAVDLNGNTLTNDDGEPLYVQGVAVTVDNAEGKPGETVTVKVTMSAVTDLTTLLLQLEYDPEALEYISGETVGFLKEAMAWATVTNDVPGAVSIGATHANGVDGEGVIAVLRFQIKETADARDYRLSLRSSSEMQADDVNIPLSLYSGEVRVMGEDRNIVTPIVIVGALVVIALGTGLVAVGVNRKKGTGTPETAAKEE